MPESSKTSYKFVKFLLVGGIAFFIDAGILQILVQFADLSPYLARCFSFLGAVLFTWVCNRKITFNVQSAPSLKEFGLYISTQSIGLFINFGIYSLCLFFIPITNEYPIIALIPATGTALLFNFAAMNKVVFK